MESRKKWTFWLILVFRFVCFVLDKRWDFSSVIEFGKIVHKWCHVEQCYFCLNIYFCLNDFPKQNSKHAQKLQPSTLSQLWNIIKLLFQNLTENCWKISWFKVWLNFCSFQCLEKYHDITYESLPLFKDVMIY